MLQDLPRALEVQEARIFAAAKRAEAAGDKARAVLLFDLSRQAYHARERIRAAAHGRPGLDEALEQGNQLCTRLTHTL